MLNALVCGEWDGTNLWLQWEDASPSTGYMVRISLRKKTTDAWGKWLAIGGPKPLKRAWIVVPTWKEGWQAMAQVAPFVQNGSDAPPQWETAQEVVFVKSTAPFEIESLNQDVRYDPRQIFHSVVDGAACEYVIGKELFVAKGTSEQVTMTARLGCGFSQLDKENDFLMKPLLGLTIRNTGASANDTTPAGRSFTVIARRPREGGFSVVFGKRNNYAGE